MVWMCCWKHNIMFSWVKRTKIVSLKHTQVKKGANQHMISCQQGGVVLGDRGIQSRPKCCNSDNDTPMGSARTHSHLKNNTLRSKQAVNVSEHHLQQDFAFTASAHVLGMVTHFLKHLSIRHILHAEAARNCPL